MKKLIVITAAMTLAACSGFDQKVEEMEKELEREKQRLAPAPAPAPIMVAPAAPRAMDIADSCQKFIIELERAKH